MKRKLYICNTENLKQYHNDHTPYLICFNTSQTSLAAQFARSNSNLNNS